MNINLKIPNILIIYLILIPLFAFGDVIWFKKTSYLEYLITCCFEGALFFSGFIVGQWATKK